MPVKEVRESREEKLIKLQLTISTTRKTVELDSPNKRTLGRKLGELKAAWNEFQEVHVRYLLKEKREDEKNAANEQYENFIGEIDYIIDTGDDKLEKLSISSENPKVSTINNQRDVCLVVTRDVKLELSSENSDLSNSDDKQKTFIVDIGNEKHKNLNIDANIPSVSITGDEPKDVVHTSSRHTESTSVLPSSQLVSYSLSPVHSSQSPTRSQSLHPSNNSSPCTLSTHVSSQLVSYSPSPPHTPQARDYSQPSLVHCPESQMYSPKSLTCLATPLQVPHSPKSSSPFQYLKLVPFSQLSANSSQTFKGSPPISHPPGTITSSPSRGTPPQTSTYSLPFPSHSPQSTICSPSPVCSPKPSDYSPSFAQSPQSPTCFSSPLHVQQTHTFSPSINGSPPSVPLSPTPFQLNLFSQDLKWLLPIDECNSNHSGSQIKKEISFPILATDLPENNSRKRKLDFEDLLEDKVPQNQVRSAKFNSEHQSKTLSRKWQKEGSKDVIEKKKVKTKSLTDNELLKLLSVGSAFRNGKIFHCFHCQYEGKDGDHFTSKGHQNHMKDCNAKILDCPENAELSAEINKLRSNWELLALPNWNWKVDKKSPYHGYYCLHCKEPFTDMRHVRGKKHLTHMSDSRCDPTCKMVKYVNTSVKGSKFCIICDANLGTLQKVYQRHVKGTLHSKNISKLLRK